MHQEQMGQSDFGAGQKKLSIYLFGFMGCSLLTLASFGVIMLHLLNRFDTLTVIFASALAQFFLQLLCFLRLNTETEQARTNVLSFIFTLVIMISVIAGSMWIIWNLDYYTA